MTPPTVVAYSYVRFSHPDQAKGDSLRRQTEAAAAWCEKTGVVLDTSTTLHDLGKSAFTGGHRVNPDRHALAAFLKLVEAGKVPRGSFLVVENLDRLSREDIQPALLLVLNLMQAGVRIVQLKPVEMVFDDKSDTMPVMMMIMELSRGHGESAIKSERIGSAWAEKKRRAREGKDQKATNRMGEGCQVITRRLPAWVEERDGVRVLIPERAAAVKRIFQLAAAGYGQPRIIKRLGEEGIPAFGAREEYVDDDGRARYRAAPGEVLGAGYWTRAAIHRILSDRRALGEFQPRKADYSPDGDVIPDYFPAVVTEEEFLAVRAGAAQRKWRRGRIGDKLVNVFAGLLRDARGHASYYLTSRTNRPRGGRPAVTNRVLINMDQTEGRARAYSFPFDPFEAALLSMLAEVNPQEVTGKDDGPDNVMVLSGEMARIEAKIAELEVELLNGEVAAVAKVLREQEAKKRDLAGRLSDARQKAVHPLSEVWGTTHSLLSAIKSAPDQDDARLRLRSALRRVVDSIWVLVVPRGIDRIAAVQVFFTGDGSRTYLIYNRPPKANKAARQEGGWWARSLPPDLAGDLDLRDRDQAEKLAAFLAEAPLDTVAD
jgi:DNA invertase Pin-like site-specific DNA recombinase